MSVEKTAEQIEQEQIAGLEAHTSSCQFSLRNPRFVRNQVNAQKMADFVKANGKGWTLENLEQVFQANQDAFELRDAYKPPVVEPESVEEILPPWGKLTTRAEVDAIPRDEYRRFIKNQDFVRDVNRVLKGAR